MFVTRARAINIIYIQMIFIEFQRDFNYGSRNIIKYRNIHDRDWYYLYIDIETLNLLLTNFGIISTCRNPTGYTNCDNPSTCRNIKMNYCNADIEINIKNDNTKLLKSGFYLPTIEQIH